MGEQNSDGKIYQVNGSNNGQNHNFSLVPCTKKTKSSQIERPSSTLNDLGMDLLLHILLLLPECQSAIRCLAVSKLWYSLISDRRFICSFIHRQRLLNSSSTLYTLLIQFLSGRVSALFSEKSEILHQPRSLSLSSSNCLSFLPTPSIVRAVFNDLLLVCDCAHRNTSFYVCNPLTRKFVALPDAPQRYDVLPNAPKCRPGRFGFAWQCTTNEQCYNYRVVLITILRSSSQFIITIFSSETGKWHMSVVSSPRYLLSDIGAWNMKVVVFANGMLHWIDGVLVVKGIVAFDPFNINGPISIIYIDPPPELPSGCFTRGEICFGACQGRLRICYSDIGWSKRVITLQVWELRNYDNNAETWCLKHDIQRTDQDILHDIRDIHERTEKIFRLVGFHPNDGDVVFFSHMNHVYEYNLVTSSCRKFGDFPVEAEKFYWVFPVVHPFWPTHVPTFPSI